MKRLTRFGFVLQDREKMLLEQLAHIEGGLSQAALVRRLIRKAAIEHGLSLRTSNEENGVFKVDCCENSREK